MLNTQWRFGRAEQFEFMAEYGVIIVLLNLEKGLFSQ